MGVSSAHIVPSRSLTTSVSAPGWAFTAALPATADVPSNHDGSTAVSLVAATGLASAEATGDAAGEAAAPPEAMKAQ